MEILYYLFMVFAAVLLAADIYILVNLLKLWAQTGREHP